MKNQVLLSITLLASVGAVSAMQPVVYDYKGGRVPVTRNGVAIAANKGVTPMVSPKPAFSVAANRCAGGNCPVRPAVRSMGCATGMCPKKAPVVTNRCARGNCPVKPAVKPMGCKNGQCGMKRK